MKEPGRNKPRDCRGRQDKQRLVVGLTGSFGSGKSTVAGMFRSSGARIIDADKIAHCLLKPGSGIYAKVIRAFGRGVLKKDRTIDHHRLADIVFSDGRALKVLNAIVHPRVIGIIKNRINACRAKVVVLEAPLLIEAGLSGMVDELIVVKATRRKQIERIREKTSLSRTDILKRIRRQLPLSKKLCLADFVIDNSGSIEKTRKQVEQIRRRLWRN